MEVKLSPELQAKLDSMAAQQGRDSASLVHEAVERLIGYDEWFIRQVEEGLAQIDRGEVLPHEEVAARMEKLIAEKQRRSQCKSAGPLRLRMTWKTLQITSSKKHLKTLRA